MNEIFQKPATAWDYCQNMGRVVTNMTVNSTSARCPDTAWRNITVRCMCCLQKQMRKTTKDGFPHPHGRKFSIQLQTAPCISKSTTKEIKALKPFGKIILWPNNRMWKAIPSVACVFEEEGEAWEQKSQVFRLWHEPLYCILFPYLPHRNEFVTIVLVTSVICKLTIDVIK